MFSTKVTLFNVHRLQNIFNKELFYYLIAHSFGRFIIIVVIFFLWTKINLNVVLACCVLLYFKKSFKSPTESHLIHQWTFGDTFGDIHDIVVASVKVWLEVSMLVIMPQVNNLQRSALTLLWGHSCSKSVLWTPCGLLLIQCVDLGERLYYVTV